MADPLLNDLLNRMEQAAFALLECVTSKNLELATTEEDDDLSSEISETFDTCRRKVSLQSVKITQPFPTSTIAVSTLPTETSKGTSESNVRSSKPCICPCLRR